MTWKAFHNRGEILRAVTATADARLDGLLPMDVPGVSETFADELSLLGALQLRWHTRLAGRIERELMTQPMDLEQAVVPPGRPRPTSCPGPGASSTTTGPNRWTPRWPTAMAKATAKEHILLAVMAGRSSVQDRGRPARVGRGHRGPGPRHPPSAS